MYLQHYGLHEAPFSITPDPRFVFLSDRHRDALAHLLYGVGQGGGGGFVQLTGEVGTGKTTLCRLLLEQLPESTRVALVLNPRVSPIELLETICEELRIDIGHRRGSLKSLVDALNAYLLESYSQGLRVVLIIDEAQNLSYDSLEQVRLLTNLETATQKLLQIILLGQPELRQTLARPELRQLAQRITARYHLTPLDADETEAYLRHRLAVAGSSRFPFTRLAVRTIHSLSGGVPRLINVIADRALVGGYARNQVQIGEPLVERAAREALSSPVARLRVSPWMGSALLLAIVLTGGALWLRPWASEGSANGATEALGPITLPAEGEPTSPPSADSSHPDAALEFARLLEQANTPQVAWNRLIALWTLRAEEADSAQVLRCPLVVAPGVFCLRSTGSLAKLESLRRPAVLRLNESGGESWVVLTGVDTRRVRLSVAGELITVPRSELEQRWLGEYFALWRAPVFISGTVRRGDAGPAAHWVRERLVEAGYLAQSSAVGPVMFDTDLESAVRRLQIAHGLLPDGIVGPETLLALSSFTKGGPRLRRRFE